MSPFVRGSASGAKFRGLLACHTVGPTSGEIKLMGEKVGCLQDRLDGPECGRCFELRFLSHGLFFLSCKDSIRYVVSVEILVMLIPDQVDLAGVTHLFALR